LLNEQEEPMKKPVKSLNVAIDTIRYLTAREVAYAIGGADADPPVTNGFETKFPENLPPLVAGRG
jgi:hypothetical protein